MQRRVQFFQRNICLCLVFAIGFFLPIPSGMTQDRGELIRQTLDTLEGQQNLKLEEGVNQKPRHSAQSPADTVTKISSVVRQELYKDPRNIVATDFLTESLDRGLSSLPTGTLNDTEDYSAPIGLQEPALQDPAG